MLAGILVEPNRIELRKVETPTPSRGEILIKIKSALTCGTDLKAYLRGHPLIPMPGIFGHEFSGVIAELGKGARGFSEGNEVMAVHSAPCLECSYCKKELFNLCENIMNSKVLGAFAEYVVLPASVVKQNLFRKPPSLSFEEAAFLEPLSCVVRGMADLPMKRNDWVLIMGAGPIGLLHLLVAKLKKARVIITGMEQHRLKLAKRLGADIAVIPARLMESVKDLTGGLGADVVFECTGQPDIWQKSINFVRRGGTVILFGGCKSGTKVMYDTCRLHYDAITLKGVFHFTPHDVRVAHDLLKRKKIKVSPLISGRYPLSDIESAFEKLCRGEGVKFAIIP